MKMLLLAALVFELFVVNDGASIAGMTTAPLVNATPCQTHLAMFIDQCLQKFERMFQVYNDKDSSDELKHAMDNILCREYENSLMCLHLTLEQCPPQNEHLEIMGERLGPIRPFMMDLCGHAPDKKPTTTTTTTTTPTTTTTASPTTTPMDYDDNSGDVDKIEYIFLSTTKDLKLTVHRLENEVLEEQDNTVRETTHNYPANTAFKTLAIKAQRKRCTGQDCDIHNSASAVSKQSILWIATFSVILALNKL